MSESGYTSIAFWAAKLNLAYWKGKMVVYEESFVACWNRFKNPKNVKHGEYLRYAIANGAIIPHSYTDNAVK